MAALCRAFSQDRRAKQYRAGIVDEREIGGRTGASSNAIGGARNGTAARAWTGSGPVFADISAHSSGPEAHAAHSSLLRFCGGRDRARSFGPDRWQLICICTRIADLKCSELPTHPMRLSGFTLSGLLVLNLWDACAQA